MRDGRFLDFDLFSNTQAETFAVKVTGCCAMEGNRIQSELDVEFGLIARCSVIPRRLLYEMNRTSKGNWRINSINYLCDSNFKLKPYLQ